MALEFGIRQSPCHGGCHGRSMLSVPKGPVRSVSMAVTGSHVRSFKHIYIYMYMYINGLEPCLPPSYDSWDDPSTDCPRKYST